MKRNHPRAKRQEQTIRVWTYPQIQAATPYIVSVMGSLREHRLDAVRQRLKADRLAGKPGRPNRSMIIAQEETRGAARAAEARYQEALDELQALDVYCLDAVAGEALVPFVHDEQLAWFIFDLFDEQQLRFWRFHEDPLDTRRPITKEVTEPKTGVVV